MFRNKVYEGEGERINSGERNELTVSLTTENENSYEYKSSK